MNLISDEKINEIRSSVNIVDIISNYIPLTNKGKNYFGICPFHDDHSPSMSVSPERQMFKCFTCGVGGNVFTFVSKYDDISFIEAVKKVAEYANIPLDIKNISKKESIHKKEYEIMDMVVKIYQNNLNTINGKKAQEYLNKRNIDDKTCNLFKIGYALNDNTYLYNILSKKYKNKELDDLGLINISGVDGYDKFINRLMIPITDEYNQVVGFTGRIIEKDDTSPKYINTKETSIYKKGHILFNYYNAKESAKVLKNIIIVEGNMDAIRMYANGYQNVVALMGTSLTKEQIDLIKKLRASVTLLLDSDNAGETATITNGEILLKNNIETFVLRLDGAKDPDEYLVKFGNNQFKEAIKHQVPFLDYKLTSLKNNYNVNNPVELANYINQILKYINNFDNITKEVTIRKISDEYNLDYEVLKQELKLEEKEDNSKILVNKKKVEKKDNYKNCVTKIFLYLMSDSKYLAIFKNRINFFKNPIERELYNEIIYYTKKYKSINIANFLSFIDNNINVKDLLNEIIADMDFETMNDDIYMEYVNYLEKYFKNEDIKKLKEQIKVETDINKKCELLDKLAKLKKEV